MEGGGGMSGLNWIRWIPDQPLQEMLGSGKLGETRLVCIKQITDLLEKGSVDGKYGTEAERARYLAFDPISMKWVACDNRDGEAFIEDFINWHTALTWLNSEAGPVHKS